MIGRDTHLVDVVIVDRGVEHGVEVVEEVDDLDGRAHGGDRRKADDVAEVDGDVIEALRLHGLPHEETLSDGAARTKSAVTRDLTYTSSLSHHIFQQYMLRYAMLCYGTVVESRNLFVSILNVFRIALHYRDQSINDVRDARVRKVQIILSR